MDESIIDHCASRKVGGSAWGSLAIRQTLAPVGIANTMELVETVFDIFSKIYALADQAKSNKDNCKKAATRCRGIESIVKNCQKEYQR